MRQWVTRVSLSDWLAFQARIRGSKDPRLLRDRPLDGAALRQDLCGVYRHCMQVYGERLEGHTEKPSKLRSGGACMAARFCETMRVYLMIKGVFWLYRPMGLEGQSFRLACLAGKNPGV